MSDDESQVIHAQLKDGQLQIVEVNQYTESGSKVRSMPELHSESSSDHEPKFVLDPQKGLVPLDLFNFSLVRCDDTYQLVSTRGDGQDGSEEGPSDGGESSGAAAGARGSLACLLRPGASSENTEAFVMVDNERCPVVFLQPPQKAIKLEPPVVEEVPHEEKDTLESKTMTPEELIEKAKEMAKSVGGAGRGGARGRRRRGELPPPHELLASPNFKLFLYSCKLCSFKCNAIKELTVHKASAHGGGRYRGAGGKPGPALQCARCPYRAPTHHQLMRHVQEKHLNDGAETETVHLDSIEAEIADVLVCGACGFESSSKLLFKKHIEKHIDKRAS